MKKVHLNNMIKIKIILICIVIISLLFINVGCSPKDTAQENLKIHFIDVGQADAILIQQQNQFMLIDAGNNEDSDLVVKYLKKQGVKELQYVIGTHPHEDHIGGLDKVIDNFDINKVIMPKKSNNTKTFEDVLEAVKNKDLKITLPKVGDTYNLGDGKWTIVGPNGDEYEDLNNYSIVIRYVFGNTSFLFTGDAEQKSEMEILTDDIIKDLQSDVLKVGHHGSTSSTSQEFLNAVNPKYAVISVGEDNKYGHPHEETITKLQEKNIEILRTDEEGTIVISSDGKELSIEGAKKGENKESNKETNQFDIIISHLDKKKEIVTIENISEKDIDMTNWALLSVTGNQKYTFPNGFILKSNSSITITSGDTEGTLQWGNKNIWNNSKSDPAELYDENGKLIYRLEN